MNLTKIYFSSSFEKYIKITKKLFFWVNVYIPLLILQDLQSSETWKVIFSFSLVVLYNEVIKRTSSLFIFFFFFEEKILRPQQHVTPRSLCACKKLLSLLFCVSLFLFCLLIFTCGMFLCMWNLFIKKN